MSKEQTSQTIKERMDQEKIKRITDEIQKAKNKTTSNENNIVEQKIGLYQKLNSQLMDMVGSHTDMLKQVRSQPIDVVEKLLEQSKS